MSEKVRPSRRQALLGERAGSYAIARHVRMSATKVRRVADLIRGMDATEALTVLEFAPQAASEPIRKVVASAMANAEYTDELRQDELFVSQIFVDESATMRRIRPRAKGSASRILKRASHITVVVEPYSNKDLEADAKPAAKAKAETKVDAKSAKDEAKADKKPSKKAADKPAKSEPKASKKKAADEEKGA